MIIYKITNKTNGKIYVGQTMFSIDKRWSQHCKASNKRGCPLLRNAILKYGKDNFILEKIEDCESRDIANEREIYWIQKFKSFGNGYNLRHGGVSGQLSEESKEKISKALTGRPSGTKGKKYPDRKVWNKGIPWPEEVREKLSKSHMGLKYSGRRKLSEESKKKMSASRIGKAATWNNKMISCVNTGEVFASLSEAAILLNLSKSKISNVLHKKRKHTKGYVFNFVNTKQENG